MLTSRAIRWLALLLLLGWARPGAAEILPGARVFVRERSGEIHDRARLLRRHRDGSVSVQTWRLPRIVEVRGSRGLVEQATRHGLRRLWKRRPWAHPLEIRVRRIAANEFAELNTADPTRAPRFSIMGYIVDPARDPDLARHVARALSLGNRLASQRQVTAATEPRRLARFQRELILRVWQRTSFEFPEGQDAAYRRWSQLHEEWERTGLPLIGRALALRTGDCHLQAAAMTALLAPLARQWGFCARTARSRGDDHGFVVVTLADGSNYLLDPTVPSRLGRPHRLEPLDRGAYPERRRRGGRWDRGNGLQWYDRTIGSFEDEPLH